MCHVANDKLCATLPEAVYKDTQLMNAHTNNNVIMSPLHLWCYLSICLSVSASGACPKLNNGGSATDSLIYSVKLAIDITLHYITF